MELEVAGPTHEPSNEPGDGHEPPPVIRRPGWKFRFISRRPRAGGRRRRLGRLIGCALLAAPGLAAQEFVGAPGSDPVRDYLEAIAQVELSGGAWANELVDLYFGMGQSLIDQGELETARDAFHRAAMVLRVNAGPNSLEQTNYLYSIAEIEFQLGNAEAAVEALEHIYRIHALAYGEDNPDMMPVVDQISEWYTGWLAESGLPVRPSDYENLGYLAGRRAHLTELQYGLGHPETAKASRALAQAYFRTIHQVALTRQTPEPDLVINSDETGSQIGPDRSVVGHFLAGENALLRAVESWEENPNATDLEVAEAIAQVGDWNLAFEYYRSAENNYEKAWRKLAESPDYASVADVYMGKPAPIRIMNTTESYVRSLDPPSARSSLEISMTVLSTGRLQNIEFAKRPPDLSEKRSSEIKGLLENSLFRPAVVNGEVQTLEGFVWKVPGLVAGAGPR
jgi:tetratricopeptide (TPR) repeat protein